MADRRPPVVLLVEDEYLIASALQLLFEQGGARVLGPVARVAEALELITSGQHLDCALLDITLGEEAVFPVADSLIERGIRFAFLTGYERSALPPRYRELPYLNKLTAPDVLLSWVLAPG